MRFELNFIRHKLIFMNHLTNVEIEYKNLFNMYSYTDFETKN